MYILILVILLLSSLLMVVFVLMQSGKGGGLSGAFGAAGGGESSLFGANTATVIAKATGVLAVIFMVSCIAVAAMQKRRSRVTLPKVVEEETESAEQEGPGIDASEEEIMEGEVIEPEMGDTGLSGEEDESTSDEEADSGGVGEISAGDEDVGEPPSETGADENSEE